MIIPPRNPLPHCGNFASPDDYISQLLDFASSSDLFQMLCGGVHVLDFFTTEPGLFHAVLPPEWHQFLLSCDSMRLLDLLMRDHLDQLDFAPSQQPPESLLRYIRSVRNLSLRRDCDEKPDLAPLPRAVSVGMKPKKIHEVRCFADFVARLSGPDVTHIVDLGSGQNYLGRALASEPYRRRVVAVEGRDNNVAAARELDRLSGLAVKEKVRRNKKLWNKILAARGSDAEGDAEALAQAIRQIDGTDGFDFRPARELQSLYYGDEAKGTGCVQYVSGRLDSGDLGDVISSIDRGHDQGKEKLGLMAVSIHSCGNLSHHGIRSLVLNPQMRAVAIVGCCYNLMTEKLGPPTYKHAYLRPSLQAVNGRVVRESERHDVHGFPMSKAFSTHGGQGIRLNITARMMACQAPQNWSHDDSESFFTRHFFRAVLQRIFLDRGVVDRIWHRGPEAETSRRSSPFDVSTSPVTIGSLRKPCYSSLRTYVRGAVDKLTTSTEYKQYADVMRQRMADMSDAEIDAYEAAYAPRRKELCVIWTLMAFSATVVEALIVADRWLFLAEQPDVVEHAWVQTVFEYAQSPRNLVVVGLRRNDA
ncbi:hypothetical protein CDD82_4783 [Ophiocordyceps australis]|uniref:Methyltransferase domain-containing protein n=1 Tax=Ophiocordyceps australis TaxID=1399860 RepID=A0A2C5ZTP7_9HYPO|nr:hypothetical protein CDD82_4783 [Ophiocordyceps australis]